MLPLPRLGSSSPRLSKGWSQAKTIGLNSLVNSISLASQIRTLSEMGKRSRAAIVALGAGRKGPLRGHSAGIKVTFIPE